MEAGDFWSNYNLNNLPSAVSVLNREHFTLENVLESDGVINDAKFNVTRVIDYLNTEEHLNILIDLVTIRTPRDDLENMEPNTPILGRLKSHTSFHELQPEEHPYVVPNSSALGLCLNTYTSNVRHRFPYIAGEILCHSVTLADSICNNTTLLSRLFMFLDYPQALNPSCTGYFRKVVLSLLQRNNEVMLDFVRSQHIIDTLVENLHLHCCMELLIVIGWDSGSITMQNPDWLDDIQFIPTVLLKLNDTRSCFSLRSSNIARALVDLVVKCHNSKPVQTLRLPASIHRLLELVDSYDSNVVASILTILVVLFQHNEDDGTPSANTSHNNNNTNNNNSATTTMNPHFISYLTSITPALVNILMPENGKLDFPNEILDKSLKFEAEKPISHHTPAHTNNTVRISDSFITPYRDRIAGEIRLKAIELLSLGFQNPTDSFVQTLVQTNAFVVLFGLLYRYPWNSLLHALIETCLCSAFQSRHIELYRIMLSSAHLISWINHSFVLAEKFEKKSKHKKLGFFAYVCRLAGIIVSASDLDVCFRTSITEYCDNVVWVEFLGHVTRTNNTSVHSTLYKQLSININKDHLADDEYEDGNDIYSIVSHSHNNASPHHNSNTSVVYTASAESLFEQLIKMDVKTDATEIQRLLGDVDDCILVFLHEELHKHHINEHSYTELLHELVRPIVTQRGLEGAELVLHQDGVMSLVSTTNVDGDSGPEGEYKKKILQRVSVNSGNAASNTIRFSNIPDTFATSISAEDDELFAQFDNM